MNLDQNSFYPIELSLTRVKKRWGGWPGKIGEIWSLSCHPYECIAINGFLSGFKLRELVGQFQQKLLGSDMELDPREPFPLLLRFISTTQDLPVQVHPDDRYTLKNGLDMVGRDKIFYIINARKNAKIYSGFVQKTNKDRIFKAVSEDSLLRLLNPLPVRPGEVYTIPARRIHSIGKGVVLLEIQRHSNLSFKFSLRPDSHPLNEAVKILDFNPTSPRSIQQVSIVSGNNRIAWLAITPNFMLRKLVIRGSLDIALKGKRFVVYTGLRGMGRLRWGLSGKSVFIEPGQSILIPAVQEDLLFVSEEGFEVMETSVPDLSEETIEQFSGHGIKSDEIIGLGGNDYGQILKGCIC